MNVWINARELNTEIIEIVYLATKLALAATTDREISAIAVFKMQI